MSVLCWYFPTMNPMNPNDGQTWQRQTKTLLKHDILTFYELQKSIQCYKAAGNMLLVTKCQLHLVNSQLRPTCFTFKISYHSDRVEINPMVGNVVVGGIKLILIDWFVNTCLHCTSGHDNFAKLLDLDQFLPTLREESSQTNVILQYKLLASILSAVCSVIQQSYYV